MRYTRTAITQLSKWYRNILIKCAIFNAAVFIGAVGISDNTSATEVSVADWSALKSAIDNATGDTTITLTSNIVESGVLERALAKGNSNIVLNLNNKTIDVQIANTLKDGEYTILGSDAKGSDYFHFTVKDGTIQNAVESALLFDAVWVNDSSGTVSNVRFLNNIADGKNHSGYAQGGALKIGNITDTTITDSEFIGNTVINAGAQSYGGAVESYANNLLVENTKFIGNGVLNYGTDSAQTTTQDGGAMLIASENSNLDGVTFTSNKSTNSGGAIAYIPVNDLSSTIKNSTFKGNETANMGGAIYAEKSEIADSANIGLTIENTDFTSNKATGNSSKGGAIYASSDVNGLTITDSSFKNNAAKEGGAIYSESSALTTIHAKTKDVVFENNNSTGTTDGTGSGIYLNGAMNALASDGKTLTINDTIKFADLSSMLNINTDFTNNYAGTVVLDKALVDGYGINLGSDAAAGNVGTLKLGQEAANQTLKFFGAYGGTLDLQNNNIGDNLTIATLGGNIGTKLNLDYDASTGVMDKLIINSTETGSARLDLNSILISKDGDVASTVYLDGAAKDEVTLISNAIKTVTSGGYTYTFTPNGQGVLQVTREVGGITLADMLQDESNGSTFTLTSSYTVPSDLPQLVGTNREFTIGEVDGNTFIMAGDSKKGFTVANGQILNLQNIRNNADINSATAGISGFSDLLDNSGTTNIQNSYISDNSSLNNKGTLNVKDSIFDNNSVTNSGTMNLDASQDKKIVFNNTSIQNSGTINVNSNGETGSVLFNSSVTGGSIDNKAGTTEFNATSDLANLYLNGGTVKVGQNGTLSTDNLYSNSGILDLQNGKVGDIVTVDNLKAVENGAAGALLNVDFDASTGVMDKLTVNNAEVGSSVLLNSILISTDGSANSATYLDGAGAQNVSVTSSPVVSAMTSQGWVYTFTPDSNTNGLLMVTRENRQGTLEDAIKNSAISSWSLVNDYTLGSSNTMVLSGADRNFTIGQSDGNTYVLNGNGSSGIQVGNGQTLNIQNIKNNNDIANATDGVSGFSKFITGTQGSRVNVVDTYFTQNTGNVISNSGELTVSGSKFANNNNASSSNGVISNLGTLSIENTDFENNTNADNGGAIYNSFDATIDKISGKFISNKATAGDGGAIYNYSTITNIDSAEFDANSADEGGAIYNSGSIDSIAATFNNNNSNYQYGGGGAIYNSNSINKIAADFEGNTAAGKGGAIHNTSSASIGEISGKFASNTATSGNGGAIYNDNTIGSISGTFSKNNSNYKYGGGGAIYNNESITEIAADFEGNTAAGKGGAIYNAASVGNINGEFTGNIATGDGGAIYNNDTITTIESAVFSGNSGESGGAIYNNGTIDSINASFSNNKSTTGYTFYGGGAIYNAGVIKALTGDFIGNSTTGSGGAIYNNGTINIISTADKGVEFSNNTANGSANSIYNSYNKTLNFNADSANNIVVNDGIINQSDAIININMTGTGDSGNTIATNAPTNGVVEFNGNYSGAGTVNLYDGTLKLGSGNKTFSTFGANGGTLDMQNNTAGDVLTISTLQGNGNVDLKLDYDASNGTMDSLAVNGYTGSNVGLLLTSVNVTSDGESTKGTYLTGRSKNSVNVITDAITAVTSGGYKYTFTPDATKGVLIVTREDSGALIEQGLQAAIADASVDSFSVNNNYTAVSSLGTLAGDNRNFTIYGNTNDIIASGSVEGVRIYEGQTLTIDEVGDINNYTSKGFSGFNVDYYTTIENWGATLNISDSVFSDNSLGLASAVVYNFGEANITNSIFRDNGTAISNTVLFSSDESSVEYLGVANITDTDFINNESDYGAITNSGTMSIVAQDKNVLFSGNNSTTTGGAIYNADDNLPLAGLGVLNLNAKNGHKITFAAATDSANNDIYNDATINLNEGNIEILSAITDAAAPTGTTNIGTTTTTATVVANAITQKALNINNGSSLAIDADGLKIADTINNLGSIALGDGTLTSAINGTNGTTVINGNVTLANNLTNQNIEITNGSLIANSTTDYIGSTNNLTIKNNGILDLSSEDKSINTVTVTDFTVDSSATNASGIKFDVNFDGANVSNDKVSVAGTATGNLNVQSVNVKGELEGDIDTTTKTFNLVEGSNLSGLNLISDSIRTVTGQYAYDFTAGANDGELIVTKTNGMTLQEAIGQKGVDYNVTSYSLTKDYTVDTLGYLEGDNRNFTIYGNTNDIIMSGGIGVLVSEGQTLTIDKVGDFNDPASIGFSGLKNVFQGSLINNSGTLSVADSIFSDDGADKTVVINIGNANITGSIFKDSGTAISNVTSYSDTSVGILGVVNITDTDFINNESYHGAIYNEGLLSIVAQDKDVLFSENNNSLANVGGAIFNTNKILPFTELGVLNINAKNGHKITFAAATDSANNDIFNDATINLNEGNIEILSAITDAVTQRGTTNIGTKDTTATVVANAITQKALNINNGSSLAINADNLKIADTINNSGTITLGDGTLTSAIGGTDGTTVIDGDVVASSAISQAITVSSGKSLTTSANNIGGAIANSGTVNLNSGTLAQTITGGDIYILASQEVTSDLSKVISKTKVL